MDERKKDRCYKVQRKSRAPVRVPVCVIDVESPGKGHYEKEKQSDAIDASGFLDEADSERAVVLTREVIEVAVQEEEDKGTGCDGKPAERTAWWP